MAAGLSGGAVRVVDAVLRGERTGPAASTTAGRIHLWDLQATPNPTAGQGIEALVATSTGLTLDPELRVVREVENGLEMLRR